MPNVKDQNEQKEEQARNIQERVALNNAYAALQGQQNIQSFSAFTFEEALDAQIESIEGASTDKRPNKLERVTRVEQEALQAIAKLKEIPPEYFQEPSADEDVNTEE